MYSNPIPSVHYWHYEHAICVCFKLIQFSYFSLPHHMWAVNQQYGRWNQTVSLLWILFQTMSCWKGLKNLEPSAARSPLKTNTCFWISTMNYDDSDHRPTWKYSSGMIIWQIWLMIGQRAVPGNTVSLEDQRKHSLSKRLAKISVHPMEDLMQLWYDEVEYYDYATGDCSTWPCGHYTQIVWSSSREIGCAWAYCSNMTKSDIINANYLVCNYGPTGNYVGQKPYKTGQACTTCATGQFWCDNGLCRRDCTRQNTKCTCEADCQHCGRTIQDNCTCECAAAWHGTDCAQRCLNTHEYCGANPGWPVAWCNVSYVTEFCPVLCSLCMEWTPGRAEECGDKGSAPTVINRGTTPATRRRGTTADIISAEMYQPVGANLMTPTNPPKDKTTMTTTSHNPNEILPKSNNKVGHDTRTNKINGAIMLNQHNTLHILITIMEVICC